MSRPVSAGLSSKRRPIPSPCSARCWSRSPRAASRTTLKPGGRLVTIKADALPPSRDDIRTVVFIQESSRAQLTELARLVDQGHLRPQVGAVYPLAQAVEAYSAKAAGGTPGRIVLQP
jgi:NADPH:quinone reductase-like Zn-dependent oxidoreductase